MNDDVYISTYANGGSYILSADYQLSLLNPRFVKYGYKISSWSYDAEGQEAIVGDALFLSVDTAVYAQWMKKWFNVKFYDNESLYLSSQDVQYKNDAIPPKAPDVKGQTFTYWEPACTNITANTSCYAHYEFNPSVIYRRVDQEIAITSEEYPYKTIIFSSDVSSPENFKREYYYISDKYYKNTTFEEEYFTVDEPSVLLSSNITLYVKETEKKFNPIFLQDYTYDGNEKGLSVIDVCATVECPTYTINYMLSGGEQWSLQSPTTTYEPIDVCCRISSDDFRTFLGLYTVQALIGGYKVIYNYFQQDNVEKQISRIFVEGSNANIIPEPSSTTMSSFVKWDREEELSSISSNITTQAIYDLNKYTVSFRWDQFGNYEEIRNEVVKYGNTAKQLSHPTRNGWKFLYWGDIMGTDMDIANRAIVNDISTYAFMKKYVDLSVKQIYGQNENIICCCQMLSGDEILSSEIWENYLSAITPENWKFTTLYPSKNSYILNDDTMISAQYKYTPVLIFGTIDGCIIKIKEDELP